MYKPGNMYSAVNSLTYATKRFGIALLTSATLMSNPVLGDELNLAGNWRHKVPNEGPAPSVQIVQKGDYVEGKWARNMFNNCSKGDLWFKGNVKDSKVEGTRYLCSGGSQNLNLTIKKGGGEMDIGVIVNGFPDTDTLEKVN